MAEGGSIPKPPGSFEDLGLIDVGEAKNQEQDKLQIFDLMGHEWRWRVRLGGTTKSKGMKVTNWVRGTVRSLFLGLWVVKGPVAPRESWVTRPQQRLGRAGVKCLEPTSGLREVP